MRSKELAGASASLSLYLLLGSRTSRGKQDLWLHQSFRVPKPSTWNQPRCFTFFKLSPSVTRKWLSAQLPSRGVPRRQVLFVPGSELTLAWRWWSGSSTPDLSPALPWPAGQLCLGISGLWSLHLLLCSFPPGSLCPFSQAS